VSGFNNCEFIAGVDNHEALPTFTLPEIAFAGRSNVGKSSLINAVVGRKDMARTSQTPGRTRQLNFFDIERKFILVDLPGYGYAKASKRDIKSWNILTKDYLCGRPTLRRVFLLLDARRDYLSPDDLEWMQMFDDAAVSFQLVLTKADKVSEPQMNKRIEQLQLELKKHQAAMLNIIITSSETGVGVKELRGICLNI
jgi:GTP-binding protein